MRLINARVLYCIKHELSRCLFEVEVLFNEHFIVSMNTTSVPLPFVITVINCDPSVSVALRTNCKC